MRLRNPKDMRHVPAQPGADRLAALVRVHSDDLAVLRRAEPLAPALAPFDAELERAERVLRLPDEIAAADEAEHSSALKKAVSAVKRGNLKGVFDRMSERRAPVDASLALEASEQVVREAHEAAVEAAHEAWPAARRQLVADAQAAHREAAEAVAVAAEKVRQASELYSAVSAVDSDMLARYPEEKAIAESELRQGIPWLDATHTGRQPLKVMPQPGARPGLGGTTPNVDLQLVLQTLVDAVGMPDEAAFPPSAWTPPNDPEHDALLAQPLDLEAPWVVAAVRRQSGGQCGVCLQPNAEAVVEQAGALVLVHERCASGQLTDSEKRTAEKLARYTRTGWPAQP